MHGVDASAPPLDELLLEEPLDELDPPLEELDAPLDELDPPLDELDPPLDELDEPPSVAPLDELLEVDPPEELEDVDVPDDPARPEEDPDEDPDEDPARPEDEPLDAPEPPDEVASIPPSKVTVVSPEPPQAKAIAKAATTTARANFIAGDMVKPSNFSQASELVRASSYHCVTPQRDKRP